MRRFYVGRTKCCRTIAAALVHDEYTSEESVAEFAKSMAKTKRLMDHLDLSDEQQLEFENCTCGAGASGGHDNV